MVRCVNGDVQVTLDCEPVFDYGRHLGEWEFTASRYHELRCRSLGPTTGDTPELVLTSDLNLGFEGPRAVARTLLKEGDVRFVALSWGGPEPPRHATRRTGGWSGPRITGSTGWRAARFPDHPWRSYLERIGAHAEGADVRADRRGHRGGDDLAARDAGRRAELGLPLRVGAGRDVRAVGPVHAGVQLGGARLPVLHRGDGGRRGPAPGDVRDRRREAARGARARPPARLRGRPAGPHRQRGVQAAPARRLGRRARLGVPPRHPRRPRRVAVADPRAPGRGGARALARARPRDLGGPRRAPPLHVVEGDVLGGRSTAVRGSRTCAKNRSSPRSGRLPRTRSSATCSITRSTSGACSPSTTTRRLSMPRCS